MGVAVEYHDALAQLAWQIELGADEAIGDDPLDRYDLPVAAPKPVALAPKTASAPAAPAVVDQVDPVVVARQMAQAAQDIAGLQAALAGFEYCDLKNGARSLVFADGKPSAPVMVIGEASSREEDTKGMPFVGAAGNLLDRMFAAIGMDRASPEAEDAIYLSNFLPWRLPQNRDPKPDELAMLMPFVKRHVELAEPKVVVLMGNIACQGVLGRRGITRMRGQWQEAWGRPALPMLHPDALMKNPLAKREAWADLLSLKEKLGRA